MSKLWKPDNAGKVIPVVLVRPLLPPQPQASMRLRPQHMHWQLGRYVEDLSFGPGGRGKRRRWVVDAEAEQHNLVLNNAYELMAANDTRTLIRYAVVGTGSTPPNPNQLGLAQEVARTDTDQNGSTSTTSWLRVANGVYELTAVREFTASQVGNRNLTEWGFSPSSSAGGNLISRELFRDGNGNPVVITPASDQRLRLIYKIRIGLAPVVPVEASINIAGIGVRTGRYVLTISPGGHTMSYPPDLYVCDSVRSGSFPANSFAEVYLNSAALQLAYTSTSSSSSTTLGYKVPTGQPYTPGSRQRATNNVSFGPSEANGTIRTIGLGGRYGGGLRFVLDDGQEFTKTNLYRLTIGPFVITWGP